MVAGIDIGNSSVKFVQVKRGKGGKLQIVNAGLASLGELSTMPEDHEQRAESTAAVLKKLLSDRRAKLSKAHTCVSGRKVITRYTHVPPMPHDRLDKVMAFEIDNETPAGGGEIASDFVLLDLPNKASEFTILVGLAKEEVIQQQNRIFRSADVAVDDISIGCLATFNCYLNAKRQELDEMSGPCAIVNIGFDKMEVAIAFGRNLYFARSLSPGGNIFTEMLQQELSVPYHRAEQIKRENAKIVPQPPREQPPAPEPEPQPGPDDPLPVDDIPVIPVVEHDPASPPDDDTSFGTESDEEIIPAMTDGTASAKTDSTDIASITETAAHNLINSLRSCLRHAKVQIKLPELQIERIYLTGGGAQLPGLCGHMQERLGIKTEMLDPLENVDYSPCRYEARELLESDRHAFATAIGLVAPYATDSGIRMSLLPKSVKQQRKFMEQGIYAIIAAVIFVLTVFGMGASTIFASRLLEQETAHQRVRIDQAQQAQSELGKLKSTNVDLASRAGRMTELMTENRTRLAALAVLRKLVPDQLELTDLRTFSGNTAPAYRTADARPTRAARLRGMTSRERPPKVLILAGRVPGTAIGEISGEEMHRIIGQLGSDIREAIGPGGEKLFRSAEVRRASADAQREGRFEILITLADEEGATQ